LAFVEDTEEELSIGEADRDFDPDFLVRFGLVGLLELDLPSFVADLPLLGGLLDEGISR
jgi:hypothetical protein